MEQARATQTTARAALLPTLDAQASASRGVTPPVTTPATTAQAGLQAGWEIDLFGANQATRDAATERLAGAQALWHEARVSVAAEVALQVSSLRTCLQQLDVAERDAQSRAATARLTQDSQRAGFTAPATAALASASAAEATARGPAAHAVRCGLQDPGGADRRARARPAQPDHHRPVPGFDEARFTIAALPVQVVSQRPDVYNAEREVAAASAEVGNAQAQRWPRLSLTGTVGTAWSRAAGTTTDLSTWSFGPLALSLPLLDGGRRTAQVDAARARYDEAVAVYQGRVRQAVSEVEQAWCACKKHGRARRQRPRRRAGLPPPRSTPPRPAGVVAWPAWWSWKTPAARCWPRKPRWWPAARAPIGLGGAVPRSRGRL